MNQLLPLTQLIYSSWILGAREEPRSIPTGSPGPLDYALRDISQAGLLPDWANNELHFVNANAGMACVELPQIQKLATEAKLTSDPNPSYTRSDIEVSDLVAYRCLARLGVAEAQAKKIGEALREAVKRAEEQLEASAR